MVNPNLPGLLAALRERPRCESDAFAYWLGLNPRETNPWSLEGVDHRALFEAFRAAVKTAGVRVTGLSLEGFLYHAPST